MFKSAVSTVTTCSSPPCRPFLTKPFWLDQIGWIGRVIARKALGLRCEFTLLYRTFVIGMTASSECHTTSLKTHRKTVSFELCERPRTWTSTYHPEDGISCKRTQQLFDEHCGKLFQKELQIERPTIAYSRPFNIGEQVTKAKLHQAPGRTADITLGDYKAGLHPT